LRSKSIPDFSFEIDQRFSDKIRSLIFRSKSIPEIYFLIAITIPIEKPIRINQTLFENFSSNPDFSFSIKP